MKKSVILLFIFLLLFSFSFISAINEPTTPIGDEDLNKIQSGINQVPIDPGTGQVDQDKLNLGKSKAEERMDAINNWTENNASWLRFIFGMVPEISWKFAFNFLIILFFINLLFLNSDYNISNLLPLSETTSRIIGLLVLISVILLQVTVKMATIIDDTTR